MKMYKKSELSMNNGLIVSKDGDIILPDVRVVDQANMLETFLQESAYLDVQPEVTPMPSLDGFKRASIHDTNVTFTATTPLMDKKAEEAMAIMDELDDVITVDKANEMVADFAALLDFVANDFVIDCGSELYCFDTPMIGDVLKLTRDKVIDIIATICGMAKEDITKHDVPSNGKMDGEGIMNSLNKLTYEINDLCNDIEEAGSKE